MSTPFDAQAAKSATGFLTGGGTVAVKFPKVGYEFEGKLIKVGEQRQQTDMRTGELMFFENRELKKQSELQFPATARPAMELLLEFQGPVTNLTWETNQYIEKPLPDDDGVRTAYVRGNLQKAMGKALKEAGNIDLELGQVWKITRTENVKAGTGVAYTYKAEVKAADPAAGASEFLQGGAADAEPDPFGG